MSEIIRDLIVVDLETTGLHPETAGIVEIGAVRIRDRTIRDSFQTFVWPGYERICLPEHRKVLEISGISAARVMDAPESIDAVRELLRWTVQGNDGSELECPFYTSFNVPFDRAFLRPCLPVELGWAECVMRRCQRELELGHPGRGPSLAVACEHLGICRNVAHRALDDARAAAEVWLALEARR